MTTVSASRCLTTHMLIVGLILAALAMARRPAAAQSPAEAAAGQGADIWTEDQQQQDQQLELTKEQIEELLKELDRTQPQRSKQLRELREQDPIQFALVIHQIARRQAEQAAEAGRQGKQQPGQTGRQQTDQESRQERAARFREYLLERLEEYMAWLEENAPAEAKRLEVLRPVDPEEFVNQVAISRRRYEPVMRAQKRNPELAKLMLEDIRLQDRRDGLLAQIAEATDDGQRNKLVDQLAGVVSQRFDVIVKKRRIKFAEIESRIEKMRRSLQTQKAELQRLVHQKRRVTQQRLRELLQPAQPQSADP